jgi:hypothetical protein
MTGNKALQQSGTENAERSGDCGHDQPSDHNGAEDARARLCSRVAWRESIRFITPRFSAMPRPPRPMASSNQPMAPGTCNALALALRRLPITMQAQPKRRPATTARPCSTPLAGL